MSQGKLGGSSTGAGSNNFESQLMSFLFGGAGGMGGQSSNPVNPLGSQNQNCNFQYAQPKYLSYA